MISPPHHLIYSHAHGPRAAQKNLGSEFSRAACVPQCMEPPRSFSFTGINLEGMPYEKKQPRLQKTNSGSELAGEHFTGYEKQADTEQPASEGGMVSRLATFLTGGGGDSTSAPKDSASFAVAEEVAFLSN